MKIVGRDGDVADVEEAVDVGAQEEPVPDIMLGLLAEGAEVGGVQGGERLLTSDRALPLVEVGDDSAEGPLADTARPRDRLAVASIQLELVRLSLCDAGRGRPKSWPGDSGRA